MKFPNPRASWRRISAKIILILKGEIRMKVVIVEPNKPAYATEIGDDYKSIHDAVGGLIE